MGLKIVKALIIFLNVLVMIKTKYFERGVLNGVFANFNFSLHVKIRTRAEK